MTDTDPAGESGPSSRISHSMSRPLLLLLLLFLLLTTVYAWLIPPFEGFDEAKHLEYMTQLRITRRLPVLDEATAVTSYEMIAQPPFYYVLGALATLGQPVEPLQRFAAESSNPYHGSLSRRQAVILPDPPPGVLQPIRLARAVSLLGGLLTLLGCWLLARSLFPGMPLTLAAAVTATAILNPQFLFMTSTVSNEVWAAALVTGAVALAAFVVRWARGPRAWFPVGLCVGLAAVTKYSALIAVLPLAVLFVSDARRLGWRSALQAAGWGALGVLLTAGGWYLRNLWLYGELLPLERMAAVIPTLLRPQPYDLARTLAHIPWLFASYWGVYVANLAPPSYLALTRGLMLVGGVGLAAAAVRRRRDRSFWRALILALLWFGAAFASVLHWTRTVDYGEQGRLMLVAAPALGLLLTLGWQGWTPQRWERALHLLLVGLMIGLAVWQMKTLWDVYRTPPDLRSELYPDGCADPAVCVPDVDRPLGARFAGGMTLLGVDFPQGAAIEPGQPLPLTLYFTADRPIEEFYTLFLHLADDENRLLYALDGVPAAGRRATRGWRPGEVFADSYQIEVDELPSGGGLATLSLGFYPFEREAERQPVTDLQGHPSGDRVVLARLRLHPVRTSSAPPSGSPLARWEEGIELERASLRYDEAGRPAGATLHWRAGETLHSDYTVFVQVLDGENHILAQVDSPPGEGQAPTSTWRRGDRIDDDLTWNAVSADWRRAIVGLYDASGQRLTLGAESGGGDFFVLAERE